MKCRALGRLALTIVSGTRIFTAWGRAAAQPVHYDTGRYKERNVGVIDGVLNSQKLPIACPRCSIQMNEALGTLRAKPLGICRRCRTRIEVDLSQLEIDTKGAKRVLEDTLGKALQSVKLTSG